ncbi:MAG TPA: two-component system response regulator [Deltaproteobacteria bacterium]|nr:two-component system response regulator [Deltaproteobacteria bacterium]
MVTKQSTVYVIDDDESVRRAFARLLRSANLNVETFPSTQAFLESPKQGTGACIVMDIRMPDESGFDLQRKLAASGITLPVLVVSAGDETVIRDHARALGAAAFFRKPVDDQALLDAIWWAISGAGETTRNKDG